MKKFFSIVLAVAAVASIALSNASTVSANEPFIMHSVEKVCTGYVFQCKYVKKRVGLFGCRTRCVPCWVKVPVYGYVSKPIVIDHNKPETNGEQIKPGPNDIGGVNIRGESGAEVTTGR
jgi:hypothetical protein